MSILRIPFLYISLLFKHFLERRYGLMYNRIMQSFILQDLTPAEIVKAEKAVSNRWKVLFIDLSEEELYVFEKTGCCYNATLWRNQHIIHSFSAQNMSELGEKIMRRGMMMEETGEFVRLLY